jgi:hypothetical protein
MRSGRTGVRSVRLKTAIANEIARRHGCRTLAERGAFYGVHETTYMRAANGTTGVGEEFIAAALRSRASEVEPNFGFDTIFEVAGR